MTFDQFSEYVMEHILDDVPSREEYQVSICDVVKNNGRIVKDLQIRKEDWTVCPLLILEGYFRRYEDGIPLCRVMEEMWRDYKIAENRVEDLPYPDKDYEKVRDQVVFRLVNYHKNKKVLESAPHIRFADLAVTFRWIASVRDDEIGTTLINDGIMNMWGVEKEELIAASYENTQRLFPPVIRRLDQVLWEMRDMEEEFIPDLSQDIYVMTSSSKINGASVILYENALEDFARETGRDYYIIPSSIHEVLLMPEDHAPDPESIREMIREVNRTAVEPDDFLSDSLYCFKREAGVLQIVD